MRAKLSLSFLIAAMAAISCEDDDCVDPNVCQQPGGGGQGGHSDQGGSGGQGGESGSATLDLLFVVDNSMSMPEKQKHLAASVTRLLDQVTNPPCVDAAGIVVNQPASPAEACPAGTARRHAPVRSLHAGVISSSLGALTTNQCDGAPTPNVGANDKAHLLDRGPAGTVETYQGQGFLAFDPDGAMSPAGEPSLATFSQRLSDLIVGAGGTGCGYEMPLEATYRFLVDPDPYDSLEQSGGYLTEVGTDDVLLAQRAAFLRPASALAIVLLTDENDCSLDPSGQGFLLFLSTPFYRSTSVCQTNPSDPCCTSCALPIPQGCSPDPTCGAQGGAGAEKYTLAEDHPSLRCWEQKRRYGVDFLLPPARYVNALSQPAIDPTRPDLVGTSTANPLLSGGRAPSAISLMVLAGAPWQDVASDPLDPASALLTSAELEQAQQWPWLLGSDPFVDESIVPRSGSSPATGHDVSLDNPINGGDRIIGANDDLQYACIFPLGTPVTGEASECSSCIPPCDNPICNGTTQIASPVRPGTRLFSVARGLGDAGVPASACPSDTSDPYRPAMDALAARIAQTLSN